MKVSIISWIRKISLKALIVPAIVLIAVIAAFLIIPFFQVFNPEEADSVSKVLEIGEAKGSYVYYSLENLQYTGYDYFEGGEVAASYYFILEEESEAACLFFLIPVENTGGKDALLYHYTARAKILPSDKYFDTFLEDYAADIGWSAEGLRKMSGGILISDFDYAPLPYVIIFVIMAVIALVSLVCVVICLLRIISPRLHPACRKLRKFGLDDSDFAEIEGEMENKSLNAAGNMILTEHYLVAFGKADLWIIPLYNIVWVFEYSKWRPMRAKNRLVYTLNVVTSPREKFVIRENSKENNDIISDFLMENFTHIMVGYTDEIRKKMESVI